MNASRDELARMLNELSEEALQYVCRPITYAYYWTDHHDHDRLTDDDCLRMDLIGVAANGSEGLVRWLNVNRRALEAIERERGSLPVRKEGLNLE